MNLIIYSTKTFNTVAITVAGICCDIITHISGRGGLSGMSKASAKIRIMDAFEELLRKKPLSRITVEEIIKQADVSKPTFYRYFQDKYDLACRWHEHLHSPIHEKYNNDHDYRKMFMATCRKMREYKDVYVSLFENPFSQNSFYEFCVKSSVESIERFINKATYTDEMRLELYRCMHGNVYVAWQIIIGEIDMDYEKSMEYLIEIMPAFCKPILQI